MENQRIETKCSRCFLKERCYTVGMQGKYPKHRTQLQLFIDHPSQEDDMRHEFGESRNARFLVWLMRHISIQDYEYSIRYTVKCAVPKNSLPNQQRKYEVIDACSIHRFANLQEPPYTIVTMGDISCLAFLHEAVSSKHDCDWKSPEPELKGSRIFVTYAPGYGLQKPAESVGISRVLWDATVHAGLKPIVNNRLKMFDWEVL